MNMKTYFVHSTWIERIRGALRQFFGRFRPREKSNLEKHAERELRMSGFMDPDSFYGGMLGDAVLELIRVFARQGHSGMSACITVNLFKQLAMYEPLQPLTGEDHEWTKVGAGVYQNIRCCHVFKEDGQAYDIEGKIFREPGGATYTSQESRVPVTFPYTPKSEMVDVPLSSEEVKLVEEEIAAGNND